MIVSLPYMEALFERCNEAYFGGELPVPSFEILHSTWTCGYFRYNMSGDPDPVISLTDAYDLSEDVLTDLMCHEMIHYYLAFTGADRYCRHGRQFKRMAEDLHLNYGLNITTKIDTSHFRRNPHSHFWQSKQRTQSPYHQQSSMRFYKEYNGTIFEFNSIRQYLNFTLGRFIGGVIIFLIILALLNLL